MNYLDDVIERVKRAGNHFFDPESVRFFWSRISENVYPTDFGTFICTSERDGWNNPRLYTVRFVSLDGSFCKASEFGQYKSWNGAQKAARRLQKTGFPTCDYVQGKCPHDWSN